MPPALQLKFRRGAFGISAGSWSSRLRISRAIGAYGSALGEDVDFGGDQSPERDSFGILSGLQALKARLSKRKAVARIPRPRGTRKHRLGILALGCQCPHGGGRKIADPPPLRTSGRSSSARRPAEQTPLTPTLVAHGGLAKFVDAPWSMRLNPGDVGSV